MGVACALSANPVPAHATGEVLADLLERIDGPPTVALVLATPPFGGAIDDIRRAVLEVLSPDVVLCVVSSGVHADGIEITDRTALAVWCSDRIDEVVTLGPDGTPSSMRFGDERSKSSAAFVLLDALDGAVSTDVALETVTDRLGPRDVVGGLLSSSSGPSSLFAPDGSPCVAVAIVVSDSTAATVWGAAPIDEVRFAEVVDGTMVVRLDGEVALDVVVGAIGDLPDDERRDVARSLRFALLGPDEFGVVPVLGTDRTTGAVAIGGSLTDGSLVQLLRGDQSGLHDSIIRTLVPSPGARLLATTGLDGVSSLEPDPVTLVAELSDGVAVGPIVAAVVSTMHGDATYVDAPLAVVTCERSPD